MAQLSRQLQKPPTNLTSKVVQANTDGELFSGRSPMASHRCQLVVPVSLMSSSAGIVTFLRTLK
jgi:hypothetical protein